MIRLKNKADAAVAEMRQLAFGKCCEALAVKKNFARVRRIESADQMEQRAFARAGRAAQREKFAARHVEVHAAQDFQRALAHGVGFGESAGGQERFAHGQPPIETGKHPTSNIESGAGRRFIGCSSVGCWMFDVPKLFITQRLHRFQPAGANRRQHAAKNTDHKRAARK